MPDQTEFTLDELSRASNVTPRTVRYYVAEGLLPPPITTGRYASYSDEHLDRLHAIGILKEMYLPLKEIRHRLNTLTREQMRDSAFLATLSQIVAVDRASGKALSRSDRHSRSDSAPESAASYLERNAPRQRQEPLRQSISTPTPQPAAAPMPRSADTWERFQVTRDAELLIRSDRVERLGRNLRSTLFDIGQLIESADDHERNRS